MEDWPSPKSHSQLVGVLVDASVNWTVSGAVPESGVPEKAATGAVVTAVTSKVPLPVKVWMVCEPSVVIVPPVAVRTPVA